MRASLGFSKGYKRPSASRRTIPFGFCRLKSRICHFEGQILAGCSPSDSRGRVAPSRIWIWVKFDSRDEARQGRGCSRWRRYGVSRDNVCALTSRILIDATNLCRYRKPRFVKSRNFLGSAYNSILRLPLANHESFFFFFNKSRRNLKIVACRHLCTAVNVPRKDGEAIWSFVIIFHHRGITNRLFRQRCESRRDDILRFKVAFVIE